MHKFSPKKQEMESTLPLISPISDKNRETPLSKDSLSRTVNLRTRFNSVRDFEVCINIERG